MLTSVNTMVATLAAQMNAKDKEWARSREEDRTAAAAQQPQIAAYIEETLKNKMAAVKKLGEHDREDQRGPTEA